MTLEFCLHVMASIDHHVKAHRSIFDRHPKTSLGLILLLSFLIIFVFAEVALRVLAPVAFSNVGFVNTPNGLRFGWGFDPYGLVRIENPDTGEVSSDRVNKDGWRDRDRTYENPKGAFRVVILGDSQTFGYIVPREKTFTWILQDRMTEEGLNAEIINISYSGWSTSQQLEALETEGMKYNPDLVIVHFVGNDLDENFRHTGRGKFANRVPFFHEVTADDELVRRENLNFRKEREAITRKYIISKSEVLKTIWLMRLAWKNSGKPPYKFTKRQINHFKMVLGDSLSENVRVKLEGKADHGMNRSELDGFLEGLHLGETARRVITRISENRSFHWGIHCANYFGTAFLSDKIWSLYYNIMKRMKFIAGRGQAQVAISTDNGPGRYDWERSWYFIQPGETGKKSFYRGNDRLRHLANANGMTFVERLKNDERARNDSHLNQKGNRAIAMNLYDFLMVKYGSEIRNR